MKTRAFAFLCATLIMLSSYAQPNFYQIALPANVWIPIANQLDNNNGNTLDVLLSALPNKSELLKWDCATAQWTNYIKTFGYWSPAGGTLEPGEGAMVRSFTATTVTFVGNPRIPVLPPTNLCPCGTVSFLSRQTNDIGTYENITGQSPPAEGAQVYFYTGGVLVPVDATNYAAYTYSNGVWTPTPPNGGAPLLYLGEPAFFLIPCATNPCITMICGTNKTVLCDSTWTFDEPINIVDVCGTNLSVSFSVETNSGPCPWVITGTWLVTDECSNSATCTQVVTVVNTNLPLILCPSDIVVTSCIATSVVYTVTGTNACCTNVQAVCDPPSGSCFAPGTTTIVHCVATNCCGDYASCDFTLTVQSPLLTVARIGDEFVLTWTGGGTLLRADDPTGPWIPVPGATSPYTVPKPLSAAMFYRLLCE